MGPDRDEESENALLERLIATSLKAFQPPSVLGRIGAEANWHRFERGWSETRIP